MVFTLSLSKGVWGEYNLTIICIESNSMDLNLAKDKIKLLVEKYNKALTASNLTKYSEEETKKDFILPLFEALGWGVFDKNEVSAEESQLSGGRVDYGFYLNDRIMFYLEAKALKAELHKEEFANQAIRYSWNKGATWAVLTDFESLILFNAEIIDRSLNDKRFFEIPYTQYLVRFDQLWLLSKDAFEKNLLDKEAEKFGKKLQKISVGAKLSKDLDECREILTHELSLMNNSISKDQIDEGVQKLLDRLIFIRVVEDKGIEPNTLKPLIRDWDNRKDKNNITLYQSMIKKFREFDEIYNSNLFSKHPFEDWQDFSGTTKKIINILYGHEGYYEYDFKAIPADVLGSVYENYLGYKLLQSKNGITLDKDANKRKEQGIYYTPDIIVDFIVRNTLKPFLDKCVSIADIQKIKILDPACGSGSFPLKALSVIKEKYKELGYTNEFISLTILTENIYGVDLDPQAVEIARLNLLINSLETRMKLPMLTKNIKNGNSLISGDEKQLKKYFGNQNRDKKPFNWEDEYPEVIKNGGFDVIIGNPPYVSYYSKQSQANSDTSSELAYFIDKYNFIQDKSKLGRFNTLMFFIERSITLLKGGGYLGLLIDTNLHSNPSRDIRKYIVENTCLITIVDEFNAFQDVGSSQVIIILQKRKPTPTQTVDWNSFNENKFLKINSGKQQQINESNEYSFKSPKNSSVKHILSKIKKYTPLVELVGSKHIRTCITFTGKKDFFVIEKPEKEIDYPLLEGSKALPYPYANLTYDNYIRYDLELRDRLNHEYIEVAKKENKRSPKVIGLGDLLCFKAPKIFIRLSDNRLTASYTSELVCADLSLYILTLPNFREKSDDLHLFYLLALLNSKLLSFYMRESNYIRNLGTGTPQIRLEDVRSITIPIISMEEQLVLSDYVKTALNLNKQIVELPANSDKWHKLQSDISVIYRKLDDEVFRLYGLTQKEKKVVEESDKSFTIKNR